MNTNFSSQHYLDLEKILTKECITPVFQPIISLTTGEVLGYEALSRITMDTTIPNIEELFRLSDSSNQAWALDHLCRRKSLEVAYKRLNLANKEKLFLNVNPMIIHDEKFQNGFTKSYLNDFSIQPENIVFEITERTAIKDMDSFQSTLSHYKNQLFEIAIDDVGSCYSGLNLILDIRPHFIKLDMKLVKGVDSDSLKYALIKGMVELAHSANISLIAEGIETASELHTLIKLGVSYGQGYFIQKPLATFEPINPNVITLIQDMTRKYTPTSALTSISIDEISEEILTIPPSMTIEKVFEFFKVNPELYGACIVDEDKVVGIITKDNFMLAISGQYGFSLYYKKPISTIMDTHFLQVDYRTPINTVSEIAMKRAYNKLYDFVVLIQDDKLKGIATIKNLLTKSMEMNIHKAKYQNPLTGLPGNVVIEEYIQKYIISQSPCSILYLDLDNFKAFNDTYGFEKGDMIIKALATAINNTISNDDFVGHIGGDDFVIILPSYNYTSVSEKILDTFTHLSRQYYSKKDLENEFIISTNRKGEVEKFPLVSCTIVTLTNRSKFFNTVLQITARLAKMKKMAKQQDGSHFYVCDLIK